MDPQLSALLEFEAEKQLGAFRLAARLRLPADGVLALFGRSGAGKTTFVNLLAGLARPDQGRIAVDGRVLFDSAGGIDLPPERRRIGYVFQDSRLFPHLDVRANLLYGYRRAPAADRPVALDEIVALLGIGHLLRRRPGALSGGEKQRVAIGRALLANPRMLLLDEPLAALDAERKLEIMPFIERLRDELRRPIVYVSHDAGEILRLADRVVLLEQGAVAAAGPLSEVFGRPQLQRLVGEAEAGAVIEARVEAHDETFALTYLRFAGGRLTVARLAGEPGSELRLRIRARDVSIARIRPTGLSILNVIEARILRLQPDEGTYVDVELEAGAALWARITARSAHELALQPGQTVFALVKAVSIDRRTVAGRRHEAPGPALAAGPGGR